MSKAVKILFVAFVLLVMMSGCASEKRCSRLYPPQVQHTENTIIKEIHKDSIIKGATVYDTISLTQLRDVPVYQWQIVKDTSGKAELRWYKDAYGRIFAECISKDQLVNNIRSIIQSEKLKQDVMVVTEKYTPWYYWLILGILVALAVFFKLAK